MSECRYVIGRDQQGPCQTCGLSWYEHRDHDHARLAAEHGACPFGDCGSYLGPPIYCGRPVDEHGVPHTEPARECRGCLAPLGHLEHPFTPEKQEVANA